MKINFLYSCAKFLKKNAHLSFFFLQQDWSYLIKSVSWNQKWFTFPFTFRLYFCQLIHANRTGALNYLRNCIQEKSRQLLCVRRLAWQYTPSLSTETSSRYSSSQSRRIFNAISQTRFRLFSSTIKNMCLERREVIPIGLRSMYQAISRIADWQTKVTLYR